MPIPETGGFLGLVSNSCHEFYLLRWPSARYRVFGLALTDGFLALKIYKNHQQTRFQDILLGI